MENEELKEMLRRERVELEEEIGKEKEQVRKHCAICR